MGKPQRVLNQREKDMLEGIGSLFRDIRTEAGLTQRQVAEQMEPASTQARVSYLEQGHTDIQLTTLQKFAEFYGYRLTVSVQTPDYDEEAEFNEAVDKAVAARLKEMHNE